MNRSRIEEYRRVRSVGANLVSKILTESHRPEYDIIKAAKKLTIPVHNDALLLEDEIEAGTLTDFYLHEMRYRGKRIIDIFPRSEAELASDEHELLVGLRQAHCSFFVVTRIDPEAFELRLDDLLVPGGAEVAMTDVNLSKCPGVQEGGLFYIRLAYAHGFWMSTAAGFGFEAVHRVNLINAYQARMLTVDERDRSERAFVFFFKKYREFGIPQMLAEAI